MPNNISFYNSLPAKGQPQLSSGTMPISDFLWAIKAGKWRTEVEAIRATEDKEKRNTLKKRLVSFTISGVFNERKEANLIEHSGFICIDIDNYTDKSHIETDPYTYAAAYSASGNGFFVIVKIEPKKHKESFGWLRKYYYETYGIVVDNAPQNVASLRYASYDPNFEINEKSKVSKTLAKEFKKQKGGLPIVVTGERVEEYVNEAYSRGLNIAEGYDEYLNLSFALANGFGANGRSYFHKLASISPKYKEQQADRQFDIALARNMPGITVGTFWYMLKMAGINIKAEDNNTVVVAAMGKKAGKSQEVLVNQLVTVNHIPEQQAKQLVQQVYEREDISLQTIAYDPEKLIETLKQFIESNHSLRRNSITKIIEDNGKEWSDEKMNTMFIKARAVFNSPSVTHDLCQRMIHSEFTPDFNPITEYIEKNRWRNSTGNIDKLCASITSNTPMKDVFIRKWCLSILAAYSGIAVRSVLTLVGGQRSGKTQWFRRLLPKDLKRYYGESKLDAGKDDYLLMCTKLILMNDEFGGKSKHDEKLFKELTSKEVFSLRAPYGRSNADYYRLALLAGTSNDLDIMQDPTGNTRVLPVEVIKIDHKAYNEIDKDELFMELVRAYEAGEDWDFTNDEFEGLANLSKDYEGINYERECILQHFEESNDVGGIVEEMTAVQIKDYIETNGRQQLRNLKALGMQLRLLYGVNKMKRGSGKVYRVIKRNSSHSTVVGHNDNTSAQQQQPTGDIYRGVSDNDDLPF
jgi:predicted P-loop ATPase